MTGKLNSKKRNKILLIQIISILLILIPIGLYAQGGGGGEESLQEELDNLTSYFGEQGYEWLINYSANKLINNDNLMLSIDNKMLTL